MIQLLRAAVVCFGLLTPALRAADCACPDFSQPAHIGTLQNAALSEASGLAASRRNPGILWSHNDGGAGRRLHAITLAGTHLGVFDLGRSVDDVEDIAVGPGPIPRVHYLYVGDIGGNINDAAQRSSVTIFRIPEPSVDPSWADSPRTQNFSGVESFTLNYPEGLHDAESLMVDPLTGDVVIVTKSPGATYIFKTNLNDVPNNGTASLTLVAAVAFDLASAADISPDGSQIVIRNENIAKLWQRCPEQSVGEALDPEPLILPLAGETNGESITFLADYSGYVTTSEGAGSPIYFYQANCPRLLGLVLPFPNRSVLAGSPVRLDATSAGFPAPSYRWTFNGEPLDNTAPTLFIPSVTEAHAGVYQVTIFNPEAEIQASATLTVRPKPDLRITEIMPSGTVADWWELTNFDTEPVDLTGWRFNDSSGGLTDPFALPAITIAPRESIIFVEGQTAAQFRAWWGAANIAANLQIITYSGPGLGLGASADAVNLWNNAAADPADVIATANYSSAQAATSIIYNPVTAQFGTIAQLGSHGVFTAASASDIGSPGRIQGPPARPLLTVSLPAPQTLRISFTPQPNITYVLETADAPDGTWFAQLTQTHSPFELLMAGTGFFRVRAIP